MLRVWGRRNSINVQKVLWACADLEAWLQHIVKRPAFQQNCAGLLE